MTINSNHILITLTGFLFIGMIYLYIVQPFLYPEDEWGQVNGEWVKYQTYEDEYPGDISIDSGKTYSNPVIITGNADSDWFTSASAQVDIVDDNEAVIWSGLALTNELYVFDMMVPFEIRADVGDFTGNANLILYAGNESDEVERNYTFTTQIIIE